MTLTFGSLFAGVGGFDMGFEQAGWDCKFQVEWDKNCQQILNKHWPDVPKWGDVSDVNGAEIPPVDCIIFGSPCQDLSVAGKRAGLEGERSGLFHEAVRIIKEMRDATNGTFPRWTVWENVAGALSSNNGRDFGTVVNEMAEAGAVLQEYALLDAQYFGVPQRRRRVFVVSVFDPATAERCPNPLLPVSEGVRWNPSQGRTTRQTTAGTVEQSLASGRGIANTIPAELYHKSTVVNQDVNNGHLVVGSLAARDYKGVGNQYVNEGKLVVEPIGFSHTQGLSAQPSESAWPTLRTEGAGMAVAIPIQDGREIKKNQNGLGIAESGAPAYTLDQTGAQAVAYSFDSLASNSMKSSNPHSGVNEVDVVKTLDTARPDPSCNQGGIAIVQPIGIQGNVIGRQDHNGPAGKGHTEEGDPMFTLNTTDHHAVATTMSVRRLTPLECERLMGWPDDWTAGQSDTHRYKQCGNGVASPVAQWIGEQIHNIPQ